MKTRALVAALLAAVVAAAAPASAEPEHARPPGPAKVAFGSGFPKLVDHEWNFPLGGFGGIAPGAARRHIPVIFVHGNNVDAGDWYTVRDDFRAAGWTDQELFALSYNGLGGVNGTATQRAQTEAAQEKVAMGWDGETRITNDDVNVPDLYDFIHAVQRYTGSPRFALVTHSLGVTLARRTLQLHRELRNELVAFVGIAGANHGTTFCPPGSEGNVVSCNEIAAGTPWLAALNGPDGSDETYAPAKWMTVYDGTGAGDPAYVGPTYAQSPVLKGADNRAFAGRYHNDLRIDADIVTIYRQFLETAEKPYLTTASGAGAPTSAASTPVVAGAQARPANRGRLPATGGQLPLGAALALLVGGRFVRPARVKRWATRKPTLNTTAPPAASRK
jgi:pimeloyl-ACP methyl ester carboxylesterase